jgi:hypothetical protein
MKDENRPAQAAPDAARQGESTTPSVHGDPAEWVQEVRESLSRWADPADRYHAALTMLAFGRYPYTAEAARTIARLALESKP